MSFQFTITEANYGPGRVCMHVFNEMLGQQTFATLLDKQKHHMQMVQKCRMLREQFPDEKYGLYLSGIASLSIDNRIAALNYFRQAFHHLPNHPGLKDIVKLLETEIFLDNPAVLSAYLDQAKTAFDQGDNLKSDENLQIYLALKHDDMSAQKNVAHCTLQNTGLWQNHRTEYIQKHHCMHRFDEYYRGQTADVKVQEWHQIINNLCQIIDDRFKNSKQEKINVLDFGYYTGVFSAEFSKISNRSSSFTTTIVEPTPAISTPLKKEFPNIFIWPAALDQVVDFFKQSEPFDIAVFTGLLGIVDGDVIAELFSALRPHVSALIIADDMMNADGSHSLLRQQFIRYAHPYKKIATDAGFKNIELNFLNNPSRYANAVFTAS